MQIRRLELLPTVIFLSIISHARAANFTFSYGAFTSCDNFPISWSGGSPPFSLQLTPLFGTQRTVSIPSSAFNNGQGSFQTQLPFPVNQSFIATLSDASGFGVGGTTPVLKVGPSVGTQHCNTTDPGVDFTFQLNDALTQCSRFTISAYDGAVQPITITGIIPGGSAFFLNPPVGPDSFDWIADVAAGTSIVFIVTDSQGRKGGSSDQRLVGVSDTSSCLDSQSPSSEAVIPSATSSSASATSSGAHGTGSSSPSNEESSSHGISGGVIAGAIVAAILGVLAVGLLVWFFCTRRRRRQSAYDRYDRRSRVNPIDLGQEPTNHPDEVAHLPAVSPYPFSSPSVGSPTGNSGMYHNSSPSSHNLLGPESHYQTSQYQSDIPYLSNPYSDHARTASIGEGSAIRSSSAVSAAQGPLSVSNPDTTMSSAARRKAQQAGVSDYRPQRFVLHTDLEDAGPSDQHEEIVELPPQYSEGRAPLQNLAPPSEVGSASVYSTTTAPSPRSPPRSSQPYQ